MQASNFEEPYINYYPGSEVNIGDNTGEIEFHTFPLTTITEIDQGDRAVGSAQYRHDIIISSGGIGQPYIGKVIENPHRYQFGSVVFARGDVILAQTRQLLQYPMQEISYDTRVYRITKNIVTEPKRIRLQGIPTVAITPFTTNYTEYLANTGLEITNLSLSLSNSNLGGAVGGFIRQSDGDPNNPNNPGGISTLYPLVGSQKSDQATYKVHDAEVLLTELLPINTDVPKTLFLGEEPDRLLITLYPGVFCQLVYRFTKSGVYTPLQQPEYYSPNTINFPTPQAPPNQFGVVTTPQ
jgi:hypothetical protein